jgi:hypothetical protein
MLSLPHDLRLLYRDLREVSGYEVVYSFWCTEADSTNVDVKLGQLATYRIPIWSLPRTVT